MAFDRIKFNYTKLLDLYKNATKRQNMMDISGMTLTVCSGKRGNSITYKAVKSHGGVKKAIKIGTFPRMSIEDARLEYARISKLVYDGEDPFGFYKEVEAEGLPDDEGGPLTFGRFWKEWRALASKSVAETTEKKYASAYRAHLHGLDDIPLASFTAKFVMTYLKQFIARNDIATARRLAEILLSAFKYAAFAGYVPVNPIAGIMSFMPKHKVQHYATFSDETLADDIAGLFAAMKGQSEQMVLMLQFYFYTLLRNSEVRNIKLEDLQSDFVYVKTKTLSHWKVPLTRQAQEVIRKAVKLHKSTACRYLFEGRVQETISATALNEMLSRIGYGGKLKVHGIRSCGRQWMTVQPGAKESIIELCLSHVAGNMTEQAYNRGDYYEARKELMQKWSDFVEECISKSA